MRTLCLAALLGFAVAPPALAHFGSAPQFEFVPAQLDTTVLADPSAAVTAPAQNWLMTILMGLGGLLLMLAKLGLAYGIRELRRRGENSKIFNALALATELVQTYVAKAEVELRPMFTKAMEDGVMSAQEGAALKAKLLEILKREMPGPLMATLSGALGPALDGWLSGKVEQAVAGQKSP